MPSGKIGISCVDVKGSPSSPAADATTTRARRGAREVACFFTTRAPGGAKGRVARRAHARRDAARGGGGDAAAAVKQGARGTLSVRAGKRLTAGAELMAGFAATLRAGRGTDRAEEEAREESLYRTRATDSVGRCAHVRTQHSSKLPNMQSCVFGSAAGAGVGSRSRAACPASAFSAATLRAECTRSSSGSHRCSARRHSRTCESQWRFAQFW